MELGALLVVLFCRLILALTLASVELGFWIAVLCWRVVLALGGLAWQLAGDIDALLLRLAWAIDRSCHERGWY